MHFTSSCTIISRYRIWYCSHQKEELPSFSVAFVSFGSTNVSYQKEKLVSKSVFSGPVFLSSQQFFLLVSRLQFPRSIRAGPSSSTKFESLLLTALCFHLGSQGNRGESEVWTEKGLTTDDNLQATISHDTRKLCFHRILRMKEKDNFSFNVHQL
jgi:hypothetical protein